MTTSFCCSKDSRTSPFDIVQRKTLLEELFRKQGRKKRKISLILDICPAHPDVNVRSIIAIELVFGYWIRNTEFYQSGVLLLLLKITKIFNHLAFLMPRRCSSWFWKMSLKKRSSIASQKPVYQRISKKDSCYWSL